MADFEEGGLEDEDTVDEIVLVSQIDKQEFKIATKDAQLSNFVKNVLEGDKNATKIPIQKVSGPVLKLIVEYLQHHKGKVPPEIKKPIRSIKMEKIVSDEWDAEFINKNTTKVVFDIILGANYMDIKSLLHLGCAKIATMIKGKAPEEIKTILGGEMQKNQENGDK